MRKRKVINLRSMREDLQMEESAGKKEYDWICKSREGKTALITNTILRINVYIPLYANQTEHSIYAVMRAGGATLRLTSKKKNIRQVLLEYTQKTGLNASKWKKRFTYWYLPIINWTQTEPPNWQSTESADWHIIPNINVQEPTMAWPETQNKNQTILEINTTVTSDVRTTHRIE